VSAKTFLLLLITTMGIQACGQVGPLYHPDDSPPIYVPENQHPDENEDQ